MKKALISPNESVSYISSWDVVGNKYFPVYTFLGERVAETAIQEFDVASPLFWIDCQDEFTAENSYFDAAAQILKMIPDPAPQPVLGQPSVDGAQTL